MRGTVTVLVVDVALARITPACAGNRPLICWRNWAEKDHPRVCGEQSGCAGGAAACVGSPPRVRGTASKTTFANSQARITPACAGNRRGWLSTPRAAGDHPRVCGEQISTGSAQYGAVGSPPRVRGTASLSGADSRQDRITPACAGNRLKKARHLGGTHKTVLEMFSGNGVASAMPFLRFAGHSSKTREVFPHGHRKYQFAVPDTPLTYPAREHTPPLPCR